jgi:hypothetical protein
LLSETFEFVPKTLAFLPETVYHIQVENAIASKKQGIKRKTARFCALWHTAVLI